MIKIRSTFETNSSSAHTLVISCHEISQSFNDLGYFTFDNEEKVFHVSGGEISFGWEWVSHSDAPSKANYLYLDGNQERVTDVIKKFTQADSVIFNDIAEKEDWSAYIDHQSSGTTIQLLQRTDEEIWQFIMNDSAVRTGNDNTDGPWDTFENEATY